MGKKIYIIGGGIAGLTAAHYLSKKGNYQIEIFESSKFLGGRCRSFYDNHLDIKIDNGNHLCLKANRNLLNIIKDINAEENFNFFSPKINFYDLKLNNKYECNTLSNLPNNLILKDKVELLKFLIIPSKLTIKEYFKNTPNLLGYLIDPLCRSILNTPSEIAKSSVLRTVLLKVFTSGRGGLSYFYPKSNWEDAFLLPLERLLIESGVTINKQTPLTEVLTSTNLVNRLKFKDKELDIKPKDLVLFATPWGVSSKFININTPYSFQPIVNIHYKINTSIENGILGVIKSDFVEWIFQKTDHCSVTVSAADKIIDMTADKIAENCWIDCKKALGLSDKIKLPDYKVIKEKKATFECSEGNLKLRPPSSTKYKNCFITGDYINNNLPSTIEGTILNSKNMVKSLIN